MWLIIWLLFIFLLLVVPLGYGWGYRGWGFPYPVYRARSRARSRPVDEAYEEQVEYEERVAAEDTWGRLALFLWITFVIALVWVILLLI